MDSEQLQVIYFEMGVRMKKKKLLSVLIILSAISSYCCIGIVAYNWGYMQSAIDNHTAAFSAPAYLAVILGIPFLTAAIVLAIIAIVILRKK